MGVLNTSYTASQYKVVSVDKNWVVLRVLDKSLYSTYWKEFRSAKVNAGPTPPGPTVKPMYLRLEQVPPETTLVDQYANFIPELPLVTIEMDGERINVTDRITANTPNTEVPGLFRIDYRINLSREFSSPIWAVYVSIQQRPVLRKAAAGWVRDSYVIQTLNRLVMEPQFLEALHAAGEPLYGFMEANQHPSVRASNLYKYEGLEAWGAGGAHKEDGNSTPNADESNGIFITGLKLPQGSIVIYQRRMLQLREPVWPDPVGAFHHMNPETHERTPDAYSKGSVVRDGDSSYICIAKEAKGIPVSNPDYWRKGYLYKFNVLNGDDDFKLPRERLPVGKGGVEHIWITVDNQGYSFWVDIANQTSIGTYRGYYDRKHYADYGTGDMVTYISEDAIKLFKRKATDIQGQDTLIYPPGHHLNPAWDEVFAKFPEEHQPLFSDYFIVPHTNASNAVLAKTWTVSEEMCEAYGNMMGIPPLIVKECGAKWSALLFALLSRTRNTFEGLRVCFRAVGLDVENLQLSEPSLKYLCNPDGDGLEEVEDVYTQHENLRRLIANIDSLAPEGKEKEEEGSLRYVTENTEGADSKDINVAIQQYSEADGGWVTRYRFERIEPAQHFNNRYYKADLNVLARLAEDAVADLGDGHPWVKESAWAGSPSALVETCLTYEIPIYIFLRLKMYLYAENRIEMQGFTYSGLFDGQRCGAKNVIELFPSKYYSRAAHDFVTIDTAVFTATREGWVEIPYTRLNEARGSKIYEFVGCQYPLRIMAVDKENVTFIRYWQSTHTFGLLGLPGSTSTVNDVPFYNDEHFHNVTDPEVNDESDLMLANGHVGVTALYRPKELHAKDTEALRWMYILNDTEEEETWALSDTEAFTDYADIEASSIYPFEGTVADLKAAIDHITDGPQTGANRLRFTWEGDKLVLEDCMPVAIYLRDSNGVIIGAYGLVPGEYTLTPQDWEIYKMSSPTVSVRIGFAYE